jgi:hypothetical protein
MTGMFSIGYSSSKNDRNCTDLPVRKRISFSCPKVKETGRIPTKIHKKSNKILTWNLLFFKKDL